METKAILEKELESYFTDKFPIQFPQGFKDGFVKWWPIVTVILLCLLLPVILAILGLGSIFSSYAYGFAGGNLYYVHGIISLIGLVLGLLALPGLFNRKRQGWVFSYYNQLLGILGSILTFSIVGIILGLLFLALLFQVREYYK